MFQELVGAPFRLWWCGFVTDVVAALVGSTVSLVVVVMAEVGGVLVGFAVLIQWLTTVPMNLCGRRGVRLQRVG
ncbi:transmembrane protein [Arabidopsis thaliana]|uniref:Transmembrane protein n=1 Tax=Arabidopsis thaliana TaxID=3702 RepID=A0A1P8BAC6_ARATH|nr:uncharacterized protein AT5G46395 [Arabidopsis thaliana]ANM68543.1 transmembrane protein [Arabidopsis thaliana]|eukprot:NP_001330289.1 transmembrane protein [Arabidopsis thaliana]